MNFKRQFHTADDTDLPDVNISDGSVACLRMLDVVTFRDYYSPGVLFFLHTLLEGSSHTVMDQLDIAPRYFGHEYGDLVHDLICSRNLAEALAKPGGGGGGGGRLSLPGGRMRGDVYDGAAWAFQDVPPGPQYRQHRA